MMKDPRTEKDYQDLVMKVHKAIDGSTMDYVMNALCTVVLSNICLYSEDTQETLDLFIQHLKEGYPICLDLKNEKK